MKKILLFTLSGFMIASCCNLKKLQRETSIKTTPETLALVASDDEIPVVDVDFTLQVPAKTLPKCSQMVFQPQFLTSLESLNLTPVVVNGKKRAKMEAKMIKKGEELPYANAIRVENDKKPVSVDYSVSAPVSDWMPESELVGWTMLNCGKKQKEAFVSRQVIASGIKMAEKAAPAHKTVIKDVTENMNTSKTAYFLVNSSKFDPTFDNNIAGVEKLSNVMNTIKSNDKNKLIAIKLIGSASPEGTTRLNNALSLARANTIAEMIEDKYAVDRSIMSVESLGANWGGLISLLQASNLANKEMIIKIAESKMSDISKTNSLRALYNYEVLKEEFLPKLRYTTCEIHYNITKSVEEVVPATEVITLY